MILKYTARTHTQGVWHTNAYDNIANIHSFAPKISPSLQSLQPKNIWHSGRTAQ
jgi:hypothetical protein